MIVWYVKMPSGNDFLFDSEALVRHMFHVTWPDLPIHERVVKQGRRMLYNEDEDGLLCTATANRVVDRMTFDAANVGDAP